MLPRLTCKRCGHVWIQRTENPKTCPKCHSGAWNRDLKCEQYDFARISVGAEILFPWHKRANGEADEAVNAKMNNALAQYAYRTGRKFERKPTALGLRVKRLS